MDKFPGEISILRDSATLEQQLDTIHDELRRIEGMTDYEDAVTELGWDIQGEDDVPADQRTVAHLRTIIEATAAEIEVDIQREREDTDTEGQPALPVRTRPIRFLPSINWELSPDQTD